MEQDLSSFRIAGIYEPEPSDIRNHFSLEEICFLPRSSKHRRYAEKLFCPFSAAAMAQKIPLVVCRSQHLGERICIDMLLTVCSALQPCREPDAILFFCLYHTFRSDLSRFLKRTEHAPADAVEPPHRCKLTDQLSAKYNCQQDKAAGDPVKACIRKQPPRTGQTGGY